MITAPVIDQAPTIDQAPPAAADPGPIRASHSTSFPALLRRLNASVLVTTYQAGKLVMLRGDEDRHNLDTHFSRNRRRFVADRRGN
jgi:hypothetical protein